MTLKKDVRTLLWLWVVARKIPLIINLIFNKIKKLFIYFSKRSLFIYLFFLIWCFVFNFLIKVECYVVNVLLFGFLKKKFCCCCWIFLEMSSNLIAKLDKAESLDKFLEDNKRLAFYLYKNLNQKVTLLSNWDLTSNR